MKYSPHRRGRWLRVAGLFMLALATAALSRLHGDYVFGLGFGATIGLILLGRGSVTAQLAAGAGSVSARLIPGADSELCDDSA